MKKSPLVRRFTEHLLVGNRIACRTMLQEAIGTSTDARNIYGELLWPAMDEVEQLFRSNRINTASEHMATRIARCLADQLQAALVPLTPIGKRIVITCADNEPEELGAQMCADLFEATGWDVYFLGGGVPHDEILNIVGQLRPEILLVFGTRPEGVPGVRHLIDLISSVGSNPTMNIMISGGVFNRAEGLWKEVHADLFAETAHEALAIAAAASPREPRKPNTSAVKKRRRRRRPPLLVQPA